MPPKRNRLRELLASYVLPHKRLVGSLATLLFSSIGLQILNPQIMRGFIDAARSETSLDLVLRAGFLFLAIAVGQQVLAIGARYLSERLAWTATNALREDLALHCLRLDMAFHNKRTPGEMIERVDGDVGHLANFFSQFTVRIVGNLFLLAGVLGVLFYEDWRLGAALAVYAFLTVFGLAMMRNTAVPAWEEAREASAGLFGFLEEHLSGTEDIRANGGQEHSMNLLYDHAGRRLRTERVAGLRNVRLWGLTGGLHVLGHIIGLGGGYLLYQSGQMTVGTVFMVIWYTDILFRPLEQITRELEDFQRASASITRVDHLRQELSTIDVVEGAPFAPTDRGDQPQVQGSIAKGVPLGVDLDQVSFGYDPEDLILKQVDLHIEPNRVVGLLGRTGSGKTTISRLLFRLYDVQEGRIRIGGTDVRDVAPWDLRQRVGIVTQSVQLFRGTVRDNLTFFAKDVPDDHILDVINTMGLSDWFSTMSDGLDTHLASGGGGLSAGEAQLLVFTRVFLKDPGLVILDEASSRLDPATEARIELAVEHLLARRTGIIIAHRLATVQRADDIIILDDGRIAEFGERETLAADPDSRFSGLLKTGLSQVLS
ncbi:MAG: ABC transporter ATP-binding protein [Gemmatimonadetes bacterium]|jgi:ATP-binding cassette, subfamily B, bacterial|nr:ABC transporter ATP-binding protein [Gemmatimonadota bacterium]MBT4610669.1 ABC transporter ATP-binding protein [Gemmatimonadota bacterium]MBT5058599.1 ABC transporter ATP-binding protein [Gemmatimonadota bacterium]MBT5141161.1 ABC transporter ATP-binding protein [Gemmatimonadota bacterium]MBT5591980.1 ABC transporter ATP-binding protein [Gemmatimonadota bacterium]